MSTDSARNQANSDHNANRGYPNMNSTSNEERIAYENQRAYLQRQEDERRRQQNK